MNAQQIPQSRQRRVTYLLSYIHVRNPVWIETTVCLYLLYICHTVIYRKLQIVVYMKKKIDVQEKGGRVLSTSTCENIKYVKVIFKVYISDTSFNFITNNKFIYINNNMITIYRRVIII